MRLDVARPTRAGGRHGSRTTRANRPNATWRRRRAGPLSTALLAAKRFARSWGLLLAVATGILVAVVLMCAVPLYNNLVSNVRLQQAIHAGAPQARNIQAQVQSPATFAAVRADLAPTVTSLAQQYLRGFVGPTPTYYVTSDAMLLLGVDRQRFDPANPHALQLTFQAFDYAAAAPHMRFLAGGPPQAAGSATPQAIVTTEMANALNVKVGSRLTATEFGNHTFLVNLTVAGIWEPVDVNDPYWNGLSFSADNGGTVIYPVLVTYDDLFAQLGRASDIGMQQNWVYYTRADALNTGNMADAADGIGAFRAHLNGQILARPGVAGVNTLTNLDHVIGDIQSQQYLLALPLYVVVAQVVGLALLFVAAMAALLIEGQTQEIATLKSRGASGPQLLGTFTFQGVILALIAALAGPFVAVALALWLVRHFVAADVLNGAGVGTNYLAQLANPGAVALPALAGALLGVGAVVVASWQAAGLDVLAFRREQGRVSRIPFWRRYYLDLGLVVLCFVGYLELGQFGGTSTRQQLGTQASSPLLLVTPALVLLAGALLVLRALPLGAQFGARTAARGKGLTSLLAFAQVERSPGRYTRMTLLLVLAVGLGLFALAFDASLSTNIRDRAAYDVGADMRVTEQTALGNGRAVPIEQQLAQLPGVLAVSPVYRTTASTTQDEGNASVDVLAIDPTTFAQVGGAVAWRADYADAPLSGLLDGMRQHALRPQQSQGASAPVWALVSSAYAAQFHVAVGDQFTLAPSESAGSATSFVVGGIVREFPTLYPARTTGSFIVVALPDYIAAVETALPGGDTSQLGPNEFWLRTTGSASQQGMLKRALSVPELHVASSLSLADEVQAGESNPISAGMRGLLLVGAVTAALLAVLGSLVQSLLATQQRARQFAVLRTIGMSGRQLTALLLGEQLVVYVFGLVGGTLLGLLLVTATLPFLQFSDTTIDPAKLGVPSYVLTMNGQTIAYFYAALLAAFALALAIAARYATTIGLGNALRLGED
jgi:putative ABC transport system permease protein